MTEENAPNAPESLPNYIADGIPKQDAETLEDLRDYVDAMIEHKRRPVDVEAEIEGEVETVEETADQGAIVTRYNTCGDDSCRCADGDLHGPYKYRAYRNEKGTVVTEYIGKADA